MFSVYINGKYYASVIAENKWQAIDIAYYEKGGSIAEKDRTKYKAKRV